LPEAGYFGLLLIMQFLSMSSLGHNSISICENWFLFNLIQNQFFSQETLVSILIVVLHDYSEQTFGLRVYYVIAILNTYALAL